jgi:hypothetical protein
MIAGEKAEMIFYKLVGQMFRALLKYSLYAFLMWSAICFLPWRRMLWAFGEWAEATAREIAPQIRAGLRGWFDLFVLLLVHISRAATQNRWVVHARWAVGGWLARTSRAILHVIDNLRHHQLWDTIYLHYQLIVNWFGRRKLHLIVFIVGIHLLSSMFQSENNKTTEVFMKWSDLQQYIDTPIPEYLFRQRVEDGSNCHYQREASWWPGNTNENHRVEHGLGRSISATPIATMPFAEAIPPTAGVGRMENEQKETGPVVEISTAPTTTTLPVVDALPSTEVYGTEKRQKLPGEMVVFCRHCRQEHCCEVYI